LFPIEPTPRHGIWFPTAVRKNHPIRPVEQAIGYSQSQQETGGIIVIVGVRVQSFACNCRNRIHRDSQRFKRWEMNNNLRAAEAIALEGQRKVAAQSAIAVYSGAQPEQQYALYPTENCGKRQLFSLLDSPDPCDPIQAHSALRGADTKASVLIVASGSENSRGMLVRTLGNMQGRYTKENVAAMQHHSINSFAADQHQYPNQYTPISCRIVERHSDQLAATEERKHTIVALLIRCQAASSAAMHRSLVSLKLIVANNMPAK
jgi:hypothetical protein